jgi:hypothetical protein
LAPRLERVYLAHRGDDLGDDYYRGMGSLRVVDVSAPSAPEVIGSLSVEREAAELLVAASGTHAVLFTGELAVVDATDPATPVIVDRTVLPAARDWPEYIDLTVDQDYAYVTAHETGLWIYRLIR